CLSSACASLYLSLRIPHPSSSPVFPYTPLFLSILYVPAGQVLDTARVQDAVSFDAPGARYDHRDGKCTFEVLIAGARCVEAHRVDRKSTRLNSSHVAISYAIFCLKKKKNGWTA